MLRYHGFTLIELLVVVTIIVVLLAMLVPAMDVAMNAALNTVCLSNERTIGAGFAFYQIDHKKYMPQGLEKMTDFWGGGTFYDDKLVPYGAAKAFYCPADLSDTPADGPYSLRRSYGYNGVGGEGAWGGFCYYNIHDVNGGYLAGAAGGYTESDPIKATRAKRPDKTIVIGDRNWALYVGVWAGGDLNFYADADSYENPPTFEYPSAVLRRHGGLKTRHEEMWTNYLFLDGRVEGIHTAWTHVYGVDGSLGRGSENMWDID